MVILLIIHLLYKSHLFIFSETTMRELWVIYLTVSGLTLMYCAATKPNIVFILTDDQDVFLNGTVSCHRVRGRILLLLHFKYQ